MTVTDVLLMAYGGPNSLDDVPAYLLDVRGGRQTPQHLIDDITENYRRIGGRSPLLELSQAQADALTARLNDSAADGDAYRVWLGMLHWHPYIKDTVNEMLAAGVEQVVALVLAPHYSCMSIEKYYKKLDDALAAVEKPFTYTAIREYHTHPHLIEALASRVTAGLADMPDDTHVVFSAHSLPTRIIEAGDPYDAQLRETASLVAAWAGLADDQWSFCYQSAGHSPEPWLGPQLEDYIVELAEAGQRNLLSCVVGFVSDHVEVLFDIDIEAQAVAREHGVTLRRVPSLNDDPLFIAALADLVRRAEGEQVS